MFYIHKYINYLIRKLFDVYIYFNKNKFKQCKERTLKEILRLCNQKIPFYKGMGEEISNYPFISKSEIIRNKNKFPPKTLFTNIGYTSGTTGTPAAFLRDIKSMSAAAGNAFGINRLVMLFADTKNR